MKKDLRKALLQIIETADSENEELFHLLEDIKSIAKKALDKDKLTQHAKDLDYDKVKTHGFYTVGDLINFIEEKNIDKSGKILVQRVEDFYYEENSWDTLKVRGEHYYNAVQWNRDIDSGKYLDKENYPNFKEENAVKYSEEDLNRLREEYTVASQPISYDRNHLYIALHY